MADKLHPKVKLIKDNFKEYNRFRKSIESGHDKAIPLGIDSALKEKIKELEAAGKGDLAKKYKEYDLLEDIENHDLVAKHIMKVFDDLMKREYKSEESKAGKQAYDHIMKATQHVDKDYFVKELGAHKSEYGVSKYAEDKKENFKKIDAHLQSKIFEGVEARHLEDIVANGMEGKKIFNKEDLKVFNDERYMGKVATIANAYNPDIGLSPQLFYDDPALHSKLKTEFQSKDFKKKLEIDKKKNEKENQEYKREAA